MLQLSWLGCAGLLACGGGDDTQMMFTTAPAGTAALDTSGDDGGGTANTGTSTPGQTDDADDDDDDDDDDDTMSTDDGTSSPTSTGTGDDGASSSTGSPASGDWLLTIDNTAAPPTLVRIDITTGLGETVCPLPGSASYSSLAFARDGSLYVHNSAAGRIERVDPCDCGFQIVGPTSTAALEIAVDADDGLLGTDATLDALYALDAETGLANALGPVGLDLVGAALTWSDKLPLPGPFLIDDTNNQLHSLDVRTGMATLRATLTQMVTSPGLAYHPTLDAMFVCDTNTLYELDVTTGMMTSVGNIGLTGNCTSLTAPRSAQACLD